MALPTMDLTSPTFLVDSMQLLLRGFSDLQREVAQLRAEGRRAEVHPGKKDIEIRSLNFRITELQSEVNQLLQENALLKEKSTELSIALERRSPVHSSGGDDSKESLKAEVRRLKHMNEDYVKNEKAVAKLIGELGLWKERCKVLESQLSRKR